MVKICGCQNKVSKFFELENKEIEYCPQCGESNQAIMFYDGKVIDLLISQPKPAEWKVRQLRFN